MDETIRKTDNEIEFPLWTGEFGWEICSWIPWIRKQSRQRRFERVICNTPAATWPLYADFATTIQKHETGRSLDYPKRYRVNGEHVCYGKPKSDYDLLIHCRGIRRKVNINYRHWDELAGKLDPLRIASIGTAADGLFPGSSDARGTPLNELVDLMAGSLAVIGSSSGVMHLAAYCGTDLVVWADRRTYFGETLEKRYKKTWNPFAVQVRFIPADDWQPSPSRILNEIERLIS
jgi:hypothetical protein